MYHLSSLDQHIQIITQPDRVVEYSILVTPSFSLLQDK